MGSIELLSNTNNDGSKKMNMKHNIEANYGQDMSGLHNIWSPKVSFDAMQQRT